jgi:prefoldin subunit 5
MPNEALITQLDTLRETYAQQQKAVAGLQAAFKGVTNAHSKVQKALRDLAMLNSGVSPDNLNGAQEAFAAGRLREDAVDPLLPDIRRELKSLATLTGALKDAASSLRTEPVDVVRLDKALATLETAKQEDVRETLQPLREELDVAQRVLGDEFGRRLRSALSEQGIQIGGRAPRFEIGRFELEANFAKRFIVLRYGKDVVVPHAPITVEATMKAYASASKAIMGRNQDGKAWIAQFHEAYQTARRKRSAQAQSTRVNIVDCYIEMVLLRQGRAFASQPSKHTFTDYLRAQFEYDFYEIASRQHLAHDGYIVKAHSAVKSQTDYATKSMWIVEGDTPYDGRYIADVEFVRE